MNGGVLALDLGRDERFPLKGRAGRGVGGRPSSPSLPTDGRWPLLGFWRLPLSFEMCINLLANVTCSGEMGIGSF